MATSCTISNLSNVTVSSPCSCDTGGVCTVGVTGTAAYAGPASFDYTVTTNEDTSNASSVKIHVISTTFVSVWRTTGVDESIKLPLRSGYNYDFIVDWGDGSPLSIITTYNDPEITHIYALAGDHTVTITGLLEAWYFSNFGDKDKIISVSDFGDLGWINLSRAFDGCSNMTFFSGSGTTTVIDMSYMVV